MGFWIEILAGGGGGGSKTLEIQMGGGLNVIKSSDGVISTDCSCDSNVWFGDTSALSDPENSRNIFTYFSLDINDNLSFFASSFKAENVNNKTLKNERSQHCYNEEFEMHFYSYPDPACHRCANFTLAPYVSKRNDC